MPPIPGSTTSKTTISYLPDSERSKPCLPSWTDSTRRPSSPKHSRTRAQSSGSSSTISTRSIPVVSTFPLCCRKVRCMPGEKGSLRSEEHTSELQSHSDLVCRLLLEKKKDAQQPLGGG